METKRVLTFVGILVLIFLVFGFVSWRSGNVVEGVSDAGVFSGLLPFVLGVFVVAVMLILFLLSNE